MLRSNLTTALVATVLIGASWLCISYFQEMRGIGYVDSAIAILRVVASRQSAFADDHPNQGYTCRFSDLANSKSLEFFQKGNTKNGYRFEIRACKPGIRGEANRSYLMLARPLHKDFPAFCLNESGVVRVDRSGSSEDCLSRGTVLGN